MPILTGRVFIGTEEWGMCCLCGELSGAWWWNLACGSGAWVEAGSCWDEWLDGCVGLGWMGVRNLGVIGVGAGQFGGRGNGLGWFGQRDGGDWVRRSVAWEVGPKGRPGAPG